MLIKWRSLARVVVCLALLAVIAPAAAQDAGGELVDPGPGNGGIVTIGNAGASDPQTFNPLIASDATSFEYIQYLYPSIIGLNFQTGLEEPNVPGALATGWEWNEDGTQVTIHLRDDAAWNDGTPITSADYLWAVEAARSGEIDNAYVSMFETMADGTPAGGMIQSVEAPDEHTVVVTLAAADCVAFSDINDLPMVPSHIFEEQYGDNLASMADDPLAIPAVTWGPFRDVEFEAGARVSLLPDQSYPDAILGYVAPEELVYVYVPDENVETERFIAGEFAILAVPSPRKNDFLTDPVLSTFPRYEFTGNSFVFMALNMADPKDPQPGVDENGEIVPQTPHPVLGDVRVRQAIGKAVDVNAIIEGIHDGFGVPVATHTVPNSWAYNPDLQYEYDPEAAMALLDDAGWVDDDGNPDTPRVCQGCQYATEVDASFEGSPMSVTVHVPAGGVVGEQMGEYVSSALTEIGFDATFESIDWATAFLPELDGQTFDINMLSWNLGLPVNPDLSPFYTAEVDVPASGFNFVSFYNEELEQILDAARDPAQTNGCDLDARRQMYLRAQEILFEEMPYLYLYVPQSITAAQPTLQNWRPTDYSRVYDIDAWVTAPSPELQ